MPRLLATAFAVLLCLPASARDFKVLNPPSPGDPVYVIPPGICGNGVVEDGEECDPGYPDLGVEPDMGSATCETQGFNGGGEVSCTSKCTVDTSACDCEAGAKFPATGQATCWDGNSRLVECAGTGHDGDAQAGGALSYTDNGDGTITDDNTGLMWEKKDDAGGIHDKDNRYQWAASFTDFISTLNNTCDGDGTIACDSDEICGAGALCGFAGYRDWRMPNIRELQSIVNYGVGFPGPTVDPAFDTGCVSGCTECSCTVSSVYWSSSSDVGSPDAAWFVFFVNGMSREGNWKGDTYYVRAVRGGL